ncbi:hypothetical protein ACFOQM_11085 [Paenibacillus sp. GCM10012307]|uniref:Uncharacterized protein n=1 Tax=Paenibacillus roseus TaxID=2798579 RepID=A0A934IZ02_9BACL|nr:hypothetical protein [Paenibacillus roseus]MBJ6361831.1 hypothetical protein [Paenibacillus roseus]
MSLTDVKHSIAGFYYQLLIAVRELVGISEFPNGYVGVECDADVRVNKGDDLFIEVKFYKANSFSRNDDPIRHTIYNFYNHFKKTKTTGLFNIRTNVPISKNDKLFFENWNNGFFANIDEYLIYIKNCLVYENLSKKPVKERFELFKIQYDSNHPDMMKPQYNTAFIKSLVNDRNEHSFCADPNGVLSDEDLKVFINQIFFNFPSLNEDKYDSVIKLKDDTEKLLKEKFPEIEARQYDNIRYMILDSFLDTTVDGKRTHVTVEELHGIVRDYDVRIKLYLEKQSLAKTIAEIEAEIIRYERLLQKKGYSDNIQHILRVVNDCTEQWFQEIGRFGQDKVNSRYLMDAEHPYPIMIHDLFKAMGEIYSLAERNLGEVSLTEQEGLNNIKFSNYKAFSLITSASRIVQEDESSSIISFIRHTQKTKEINQALGNETIIMDVACEVCKFDKKEIDDLVLDIGNPIDTVINQSYYKAFDYKCTKCLKLNSNGITCEFAEYFKGVASYGGIVTVT